MSDRPCNWCNLQQYKRDAKQLSLKITLLPAKRRMGGTEVYMHPKNIDVKKLKPNERHEYFKAWMMEIGERCAC